METMANVLPMASSVLDDLETGLNNFETIEPTDDINNKEVASKNYQSKSISEEDIPEV
jgi:hypothetical protein